MKQFKILASCYVWLEKRWFVLSFHIFQLLEIISVKVRLQEAMRFWITSPLSQAQISLMDLSWLVVLFFSLCVSVLATCSLFYLRERSMRQSKAASKPFPSPSPSASPCWEVLSSVRIASPSLGGSSNHTQILFILGWQMTMKLCFPVQQCLASLACFWLDDKVFFCFMGQVLFWRCRSSAPHLTPSALRTASTGRWVGIAEGGSRAFRVISSRF